MLCGEIPQLTNKPVSHSHFKRMHRANRSFNDIEISLQVLKHCFVCLSQEVNTWLKGRHRLDMDQKWTFPTIDFRPSRPLTNSKQSSGTYYTAHSGLLPFLNTLFSPIPPPPTGVKGVRPISSTVLDSTVLFEAQSGPSPGHLDPSSAMFWFRGQFLFRFWKLWIIGLIFCLTQDRWYCYRKSNVFMTLKNDLFVPYSEKLHGRKPNRATGVLSLS